MDHTDDCGFTAEIRFLGLGKLWNMYVDLFSKLTMLLRATWRTAQVIWRSEALDERNVALSSD